MKPGQHFTCKLSQPELSWLQVVLQWLKNQVKGSDPTQTLKYINTGVNYLLQTGFTVTFNEISYLHIMVWRLQNLNHSKSLEDVTAQFEDEFNKILVDKRKRMYVDVVSKLPCEHNNYVVTQEAYYHQIAIQRVFGALTEQYLHKNVVPH